MMVVSSCIRVILMVAIVVILAAVIAAFVFGMAGQMDRASSTNESVWVTKELRGFADGIIDVRVFCEDGVVCYGSPGSPSCIQNFTLADKLCNCSPGGGS